MPTVELLIKGKVQGVYYRKSAVQAASQLGLTGWVKNTNEGDVQALVSGPQPKINEFVAWCWQGPAAATVTGVEVTNRTELHYTEFTIER